MKIISDKLDKDGKRRMTVVLDTSETFKVLRSGAYYRLGQPVEDVVASYVLEEAHHVGWCSASQQWVD